MSMQKKFYGLSVLLLIIFSTSMLGPTSAQDAVQLNMWTWKLFHVPGLQAVAANFEAQTGIHVNVTAFNPDDAYRTKLTTSAQSHELADIISYWSNSRGFWDMAAAGNLVELTSAVNNQWAGSFLPGTYDRYSLLPQTGDVSYENCQSDPNCGYKNLHAGQSFSVPYIAGQAYFVYGNKTLLQQAGLDPSTPATAEQWLQMMETVKDKTGVAGVVTGVKNPDVLQFWLYNPMLITSCGVDTYDAIYNGTDSFENPCSLRVLEWIERVSREDLWMPGILDTDIDPADIAFSQGQAAFDIGGTYTLGFLVSQGMDPNDIIAFPVPALDGSHDDHLDISVFPLIDAAVTSDSAHPDEAIQFLQFLTSPEQMGVFAKATGDLPAVQMTATADTVGPAMAGLLSSISGHSQFDNSTAVRLDQSSQVLKLGLQQIISDETTADDLAAAVQQANVQAWAARNSS